MNTPVNIVIPVYRGVKETEACIKSILDSSLPKNCFVTVINDCSPEPEMALMLSQLPSSSSIRLLNNESNLGFVLSVNKGMSIDEGVDVVLLNSDTIVPKNWLQRLQRAAYSDKKIGTVTPFSNNATICSYPRLCQDNCVDEERTIEELDLLFQAANNQSVVEIPTAVGFCMYIKRTCLAEVGLFDAVRFGKGYGEENDFCLRAAKRGWSHILCCDLFVYHAGSISFMDERNERSKNALRLLLETNPNYGNIINKFMGRDPGRIYRQRVDLSRLIGSGKDTYLTISHSLGGGVIRNEREIANLFGKEINFLRITPHKKIGIRLEWWNDGEALKLYFQLPREFEELKSLLAKLKIKRAHFHHLLDVPESVKELPAVLNIPYDVTIHDYYTICPRITLTDKSNQYCGEPAEAKCNECLRITSTAQQDISAWRAINGKYLKNADRVFMPSMDVMRRYAKYFCDLNNVLWAPHNDLLGKSIPRQINFNKSEDQPLRIIVLGALSAIKGADLLEAVAIDAKNRGLDIHFHLIGSTYRKLRMAPESRLTCTGPYKDEDLMELIKESEADLIWFPAAWPETYSYTLSAAILSAIPIVATDLGAFTERLIDIPKSWTYSWKLTAEEWNDVFLTLQKNHFNLPQSSKTQSCQGSAKSFDWLNEYRNAAQPPHLKNTQFISLDSFADGYSYPREAFSTKTVRIMKESLLSMIRRIRQHPAVHELFKYMPHHYRSRIKYWLIK